MTPPSLAKIATAGAILAALTAGCEPGGSGNDNDQSAVTAEQVRERYASADEIIFALIYVLASDGIDLDVRQSAQSIRDCPLGGQATRGADGAFNFDQCIVLPGLVLNGLASFTPVGDGAQGGRFEFDGLNGSNGETDFSLEGFVQETKNADGSLTLELDLVLVTDDGQYRDTQTFDGNLTVADDGTMTGTLNSSLGTSAQDCSLDGHNVLEFLDDSGSLFEQSCTSRCADEFPECPLKDDLPDDNSNENDNGDGDPQPTVCDPQPAPQPFDTVSFEFMRGGSFTPGKECCNSENVCESEISVSGDRAFPTLSWALPAACQMIISDVSRGAQVVVITSASCAGDPLPQTLIYGPDLALPGSSVTYYDGVTGAVVDQPLPLVAGHTYNVHVNVFGTAEYQNSNMWFSVRE